MNLKLVYSSVITEILSLSFIINNSIYSIITGLILHGVALFLILSFAVNLLPKRFEKSQRLKSVVMFFIITYPTLYIGYIAVIILILHILRKQKLAEYKPFLSFSVEDFLGENIKNRQKLRSFGEGAILSINRMDQVDRSLKEKAILALHDLKNPGLFSLVKESLGSSIDEVRLFAFSIVSKLEKEFNENLHRLKEKLKQDDLSPEEKAQIHYEIAKQYYNFIYYHVVDEEFKGFMLQESIYHCQQALKIMEHPKVYMLLGRLYKETGFIEIAYKYFISLSRYSTINPVDYVLPLSEIYFKFGMFSDIVALIKNNPDLKFVNDPRINFLLSFWLREDEGSRRRP